MQEATSAGPVVITGANLVDSDLSACARRELARRARHDVTFGAYGVVVRLHLDREDAAGRLAVRYRALLRTEAPDVSAYAVTDDSGRLQVWSDAGRAAMWPRPGLPVDGVVLFADGAASQALFSLLPSVVVLHAAALRHAGRAFAIAGTSTAGKTTTALACGALGCEIYSDERCVVRGGRVFPYPRALGVREGGARLLAGQLPEGGLDRILEAFAGETPPEPAPLAALFVIVDRADEPRSRRIDAVQALPMLHPGAFVAAPGIEAFATLLGTLMHVRCYELVLGSPLATACHLTARIAAPLA